MTTILHKDTLQPPPQQNPNFKSLSLNNKVTKNRNNRPTLSHKHNIPNLKLPTPSPTPISPCFVHSAFDPTSLFEEIMDKCDSEPTDYSGLAETTNCVRSISKKLG